MYIKRKPLPDVAGTRVPLTRAIVPKEKVTPKLPQLTDKEQLQKLVELRDRLQVQLGAIQIAPDLLKIIDDSIDDLRARLQRAPERPKARSSPKV